MSIHLIDTHTGTVLSPLGCVLMNDDNAPDLWKEDGDLSDSEICEIGKDHGRAILPDIQALDRIASILSGAEWDADRMMEVAEIVRGTGREVGDFV